MATELQTRANRANSLKSTGPTSQAGREAIAESNRRRKVERDALAIAHSARKSKE